MNWHEVNGERVAARWIGWWDIFPIAQDFGDGLPWRWMAVVNWYQPGDVHGFPRMRCKRTLCPLRLAHWVYMVARRVRREEA